MAPKGINISNILQINSLIMIGEQEEESARFLFYLKCANISTKKSSKKFGLNVTFCLSLIYTFHIRWIEFAWRPKNIEFHWKISHRTIILFSENVQAGQRDLWRQSKHCCAYLRTGRQTHKKIGFRPRKIWVGDEGVFLRLNFQS